MTAFGAIQDRINAQGFKLTITNTDSSEYLFLQDCRATHGHTEFKEATSSGGNVYYSGTPTNRISGTVLITKDAMVNATDATDIKTILFTRTQGEVPIIDATLTLTAPSVEATTFTYTSQLKCETFDIQKPTEGGVKAAVSFVVIGDPVAS
jgi:hypothetical protein